MERLVKFELLGHEYRLNTDVTDEDVDEILQLVKSQLEGPAASKLPPSKLAILISLNMAGKYVRLRKDFDEHKQIMSERLERLTQKIDKQLLAS